MIPGFSIDKIRLTVAVVLLGGLLLAAVAFAGEETAPVVQEPVTAQSTAALAPLLSYQARLLDPATGNPKADGVYQISFRLYDVDTGGTALWTETKDVTVARGLFSVVLGDVTAFDPAIFDGRDLWLALKVGTDAEAAPRHRILPVAYALYAGNANRLNGQLANAYAPAVHIHDDRYFTEGEADGRFVNTAGPDAIAGNSGNPILTVTQAGTGTALDVGGNAHVTGDLTIDQRLIAPTTRNVPITVGDLMYDENNLVATGDCCNGVTFVEGSQSGGSITFPVPDDYQPGTAFNLDLYFVPLTAGGAIEFFVRWTGLNVGAFSSTGSSVQTPPVAVGTVNQVHRQSFALSGFAAGSFPNLIELTIRRNTDAGRDTNTGNANLIGLQLTYQASR